MAETVFELPMTADRRRLFAIVADMALKEFAKYRTSCRCDAVANRVNCRWEGGADYKNGLVGPFLARKLEPGESEFGRKFVSCGVGIWTLAMKRALAGVYDNAVSVLRLTNPGDYPDYVMEDDKKTGADVLEARADYSEKRMNTEKFVGYSMNDAYRVEWCFRYALDCGSFRVNWKNAVAKRDWALSLRADGFEVPDYDVEATIAKAREDARLRNEKYEAERKMCDDGIAELLATEKLPEGMRIEKKTYPDGTVYRRFYMNDVMCSCVYEKGKDLDRISEALGF